MAFQQSKHCVICNKLTIHIDNYCSDCQAKLTASKLKAYFDHKDTLTLEQRLEELEKDMYYMMTKKQDYIQPPKY